MKETKDWYEYRGQMHDVRKYDTEVGGLHIGSNEFAIVIPNGYGDGWSLRYSVEGSDFDSTDWNFFTSINGKFQILETEEIIEGRYGIFNHEGLIVFVKWN